MRVDIKALSDSELQEQGFNNTSGGMHGFGLYTDDVLSAVCITTEIPDSLNKEVRLEKLFVCEEEGNVLASAIINQCQVDVYEEGDWTYCGSEEEVMVLHTLAVSPNATRRGLGSAFVKFYEEYAIQKGFSVLRMDTNEQNTIARKLYRKLGYLEVGMVPCEFNGIPGVNLVLLEKKL